MVRGVEFSCAVLAVLAVERLRRARVVSCAALQARFTARPQQSHTRPPRIIAQPRLPPPDLTVHRSHRSQALTSVSVTAY